LSEKARWIICCNFQRFEIHDMTNPLAEPEVVLLEDLEKESYRLQFLVDSENEHIRKEMGIDIDTATATALYAAICSDSGGFRYANTRAETYECAATMIRKGVDFVLINRLLFEQKNFKQINLEREAYNKLKLHCDGRFAVVSIDEETAAALGLEDSDYDVVNQIPRQIYGVEVSAVLRPREGITKVSMRSNDDFDVAEFAKRYGGGGHIHAAGYRFNGTVKEATEALIKDISELL
jgi:phosphoesterase RecJ-like protein